MNCTILRKELWPTFIAAMALTTALHASAQPVVDNAPFYTGLTDQTSYVNTPLDLSFGVGDPDPGDLAALILSVESLTPSIFTGAYSLTGAGTATRHLMWNPVQDATGEADLIFRLLDPNPVPIVSFRRIKVNVVPAPDQPSSTVPDTGSSALLVSLSCGSLFLLRRSQRASGC